MSQRKIGFFILDLENNEESTVIEDSLTTLLQFISDKPKTVKKQNISEKPVGGIKRIKE